MGAGQAAWLLLALVVVTGQTTWVDAGRGEALYRQRCAGCHSLDKNRVGPAHRGVVGRRAGAVAAYRYSNALAGSGLTWDPATLDKWLANPIKLVPGTAMGVRVREAKDRSDIIAYLSNQVAGE